LILLHPKRLLDSFDTSYWQLLWIAFVQYLVRILNLLAQVASFLFCVCLYLSSSDLCITLKFTLPFGAHSFQIVESLVLSLPSNDSLVHSPVLSDLLLAPCCLAFL
jgi:hypothetical protein